MRGRDAQLRGIQLARVVVAALDELEAVAELALVLVLQQLLRREQVGVAAPARERHGDVALAHTGRRLDEHDAVAALDRALEGGQQARLLGARSDPLGEVRE